tara:strand:+ start:369 stop:554 length:186 start_codon:yes stop_codon:yes gene_type:complete
MGIKGKETYFAQTWWPLYPPRIQGFPFVRIGRRLLQKSAINKHGKIMKTSFFIKVIDSIKM